MDLEGILKNSGLDRYDRNARIYPALLTILPVFLTVMIWYPPAWTLLGGLLSIVVMFGVVYLLAQVVRYRGRTIEAALGRRVGRAKTAALLCHGDETIPANSKLRYHSFLRKKGLTIPSKDEELADPHAAFEAYRSAVDWLLIHTRHNAKASGLLAENISYGFRRNLLGLKPAAVTFLIISVGVNGWMIWNSSDTDRIAAASIVELIFVTAAVVWVALIRPGFVEDASVAYATRFLEQCESKAGTKDRS